MLWFAKAIKITTKDVFFVNSPTMKTGKENILKQLNNLSMLLKSCFTWKSNCRSRNPSPANKFKDQQQSIFEKVDFAFLNTNCYLLKVFIMKQKHFAQHIFLGFISLVIGYAFVLAFGFLNIALADPHTTIYKKNTPEAFAVREELEGSGGVLNRIRIPHGCNGRDIRAMAVVFPEKHSPAVRTDTGEAVELSEHIDNDPVISPKPIQNHNIFGKIEQLGEAGHHDSKTRAFHLTRGRLDTNLIGMVPWDSSFPSFNPDSCIARLKVNIAIANYCNRSRKREDRADIWIGHFTPLFNDPAVVVQNPPNFWPHLIVVRDLSSNPLNPECGDGFEVEVSPSDEAIDELLTIKGYWPSKRRHRDDD